MSDTTTPEYRTGFDEAPSTFTQEDAATADYPPLPSTWEAAIQMLDDWLVGQSGPLVGTSFTQEESRKMVDAASVVNLKARTATEFVKNLYADRAQRSGVSADPLPPEILAIAQRLHTQDNRITQDPLFAVQQKRVIGGLDSEYADKFAWVCDGSEVDREESERLDALRAAGKPISNDCRRVGYLEKWEFVAGCFTEQGCKDYIACNGHNLKEPRIYAYTGYRNAEFIAIRKWLMSLATIAAAQSQPLVEPTAIFEVLEFPGGNGAHTNFEPSNWWHKLPAGKYEMRVSASPQQHQVKKGEPS